MAAHPRLRVKLELGATVLVSTTAGLLQSMPSVTRRDLLGSLTACAVGAQLGEASASAPPGAAIQHYSWQRDQYQGALDRQRVGTGLYNVTQVP